MNHEPFDDESNVDAEAVRKMLEERVHCTRTRGEAAGELLFLKTQQLTTRAISRHALEAVRAVVLDWLTAGAASSTDAAKRERIALGYASYLGHRIGFAPMNHPMQEVDAAWEAWRQDDRLDDRGVDAHPRDRLDDRGVAERREGGI